MRRHQNACSLLLVFCLIWQTLAFSGPALAHWEDAGAASDVSHKLLHLSGQPHHHHEDGVHLDDSPESIQHLHADCVSSTTFIPPGAASALLFDSPHDPLPAFSGGPLPHPFLEGLRRPPRPQV